MCTFDSSRLKFFSWENFIIETGGKNSIQKEVSWSKAKDKRELLIDAIILGPKACANPIKVIRIFPLWPIGVTAF
jgi:hypothetical protein